MKTALAPIAFVLLSLASCAGEQRVKLDHRIPHEISRPTTLRVWAKLPDGEAVEVEADVDAGWWLASPVMLEGDR